MTEINQHTPALIGRHIADAEPAVVLTGSKKFMQAEARILASMQLGEISIPEGQKAIGELEKQDIFTTEFKSPTGMQLINGNLELLRRQLTESRNYFLNQSPEIKTELANLCLSGRGLNDYHKIMDEKSCFYYHGGKRDYGIMVWTLTDRGPFNERSLIGIEEAGYKAYSYTCLSNKERATTDPEPGGIIALRSNLMNDYGQPISTDPRVSELYSTNAEQVLSDFSSCTLVLDPDKFGRHFITGVSFSELIDMHKALRVLQYQQSNLRVDAAANLSVSERLRHSQRVSEIPERQVLCKQFIGLNVLERIVAALRK